jgi:hypothetical protein
MDRLKRFEAALAAYETERNRIAAALPCGWRLVTDFLIKDNWVVSVRKRATNQPATVENGVGVDLESRQVIDVHVDNGGLCSSRLLCEDDAKWQAEGDRALPDDLRRAIRALKVVDYLDYFNGKEF